MKLSLNNIGKIKEAQVDINGITVIAGENNTGKSTVGKALFAVFNGFYNNENKIYNELFNSISGAFISSGSYFAMEFITMSSGFSKLVETIIDNRESYIADSAALKNDILYFLNKKDSKLADVNINDIVNKLLEILSVRKKDILRLSLMKSIQAEFYGQINNIFSDDTGEIKLIVAGNEVCITVDSDNNIKDFNKMINLHTEAIYVDDPFIIDESNRTANRSLRYPNHKEHLKNLLFNDEKDVNSINEIITANKLTDIYKKISMVCSGELVKNSHRGYDYKKSGASKTLDAKNLSTGLKTFVILKTLLLKGSIDQNGIIILDEPEIHLHPQWQLIFAEIIVLLHKEFKLHILLNTHSPYFLRAIQVYSAKYEVVSRCKYYLSENKGDCAVIFDVTDDTEKIYDKLAAPLQTLEDEEWKL